MSRPIYAVDLDEVLIPFDQPFLGWHNITYGTDFTPHHTSHDYAKELDASIDWAQRLDEFVATNLQHEHPPMPHSQLVLSGLAKIARLVVVTARPEHHRSYTENWLDQQFPGIFEDVHMRRDGFEVHKKGEICAAIGAAILLDDAVHHVDSALEFGIRGIVFGDYFKQKAAIKSHHERALDWQEVGRMLG